MLSKATYKNIIATFSGKIIILLCSFATMVLTSRLWGAEGRGIIALYVANLGLTAIFCNIFTNSSACYFSARIGAARLWLQAALWTFLASAVLTVVLERVSFPWVSLVFFLTATLAGMLTFYLSVFLGKQKVNFYNLLTVIQPILLLVFLLAFRFWVIDSPLAYIYGQLLSYACVVAICHFLLHRHYLLSFSRPRADLLRLNWRCLRTNFLFGLQEESGAFLQFLNYRLPYYFLTYYSGLVSIGVFSIGVALSEAVWVVTRSISLVQYSNLLSPGHKADPNAVEDTLRLSRLSLGISAACLIVAILLPSAFYTAVFGAEFTHLNQIILLLSPGILAVSASKVYAHYFSALGKLKILVLSSGAGAVVSLALSFFLIQSYNKVGACIATTSAHLICSAVLTIYFFHWRKTHR